MPRTFIAFSVTAANQERLARVRTDLDWSGADIKWVKPRNIHLTLRFLGNIELDAIEKIGAGLPDIFTETAAVPVIISGLGSFPSAGRPKVIWADVADPGGDVSAVQARLQTFLSGLGFPAEERPFAAHITLGRVRRLDRAHRLKNTLSGYAFEPPLRQSLARIVFYQSTLTPQGPVYSTLREVTLKDSSTPRE